MDLILLAVPFFFVLIALELIADRVRGQRNFTLADSINSLSTGALSTSTGLLTKGVGLLTYSVAWEHLALLRLPPHALWVWLLAFVLYDLCYYWLHRLGHERNVLWAAHSVHHQSEEYNLTTALRQTSSGFIFSWVFYLPLALLGVPPLVFITVASLNLLYQFWVHTRHIPKLGWLEWLLITPSNHRVHHAQNPAYLDRNYGGVFIFWDRLFGTFKEEDPAEPVVFGVTTPLASWNPLWANVQFYAQLWDDARRTRRWQDKLRLWFMPTGWRPADVAAGYPQAKQNLARFRKFEVALGRAWQVYVVLQFSVYIALGSYLMDVAGRAPAEALVLGWALMAFGLFVLGAALENRRWAARLEVARLLLLAPALYLAGTLGLAVVVPVFWLFLGGYWLLSFAGLFVCCRAALGADGTKTPAQPQQHAEQQQAAEHP
ncbi:sterol desaturase family protein [Pantoea sp. Ap-967]|nr:sterol desaturase family protein [Pantoea sp. Ap-967]